ncbi:MAG: hypothetical protein U0790_00285 [Isosphaeraceae bacterium]
MAIERPAHHRRRVGRPRRRRAGPPGRARALDRYSGVERINFLVARTMLRLGLKGELLG